jgi:hypothetical protein
MMYTIVLIGTNQLKTNVWGKTKTTFLKNTGTWKKLRISILGAVHCDVLTRLCVWVTWNHVPTVSDRGRTSHRPTVCVIREIGGIDKSVDPDPYKASRVDSEYLSSVLNPSVRKHWQCRSCSTTQLMFDERCG